MKSIEILRQSLLVICMTGIIGCSTAEGSDFMDDIKGDIVENGSVVPNDSIVPDFNTTIAAWDGEMADDAALDVVGSNADFYHEANAFPSTVSVTYNGSSAEVVSNNDQILHHVNGAYVTIDMETHSVEGVQIVAKGKTGDGGLKIYGKKKFMLTMDGVDLTSQKGPAINSQCKKRMFVHLNKGTSNWLTDAAQYTNDDYCLNATDEEDRKGCFFSEGNLLLSGEGVLVVNGKNKHGIATDGYFWIRPGVTLAVTDAAKNGIHVKGDEDDGLGISILGGLVMVNSTAGAGKGVKSDMDIEITGGRVVVNTSGNAVYEYDKNDISSASAVKADASFIQSGGEVILKSTGIGGKGMNVDGDIYISGGETTVTTTGGRYVYTDDMTSSPKGVKADDNITISGGKINISVTGKSYGSEGLESKSALTVNGGEVYIYAYDDAINAIKDVNISGGRIYAFSLENDGIDSNGTMTVSGGLVIAVGTGGPDGGIDVDSSDNFKIHGGTVFAIGGMLTSNPSPESAQRCVVYNRCTGLKDKMLAILDSTSVPVFAFKLARTAAKSTMLYSSPKLKAGETYAISLGGTLADYKENWNGWYDGGAWTEGEELVTFSSNEVVTVAQSE